MLKYLLNEEETIKARTICCNILNHSVTPEYIIEVLPNLNCIIWAMMDKEYKYYSLSTDMCTYIDDIMEVDSMSYVEKEVVVKKMIVGDIPLFKILARNLLDKIKSDKKEMVEKGYCVKMHNTKDIDDIDEFGLL